MNFQFNRKDCSWDAVSLNTGKLWVIEIHDNGFFQIGANVFRTFFDAVRVAELMDAEISGGAVKALEGTGG